MRALGRNARPKSNARLSETEKKIVDQRHIALTYTTAEESVYHHRQGGYVFGAAGWSFRLSVCCLYVRRIT